MTQTDLDTDQTGRVSGPGILVLNAGSSSVKFALYTAEERPVRHLSGGVEGINHDQGRFHAVDYAGHPWASDTPQVSNHEEAIDLILSAIDQRDDGRAISAVGHRIVHGGPDCVCPEFVTPDLEARLAKLIPLAPLHLPHNLAGIAAVRRRRPHLTQVACFDTAFHADMPKLARMTGLPRSVTGSEIRRYGFHGLSYEYIVEELRRTYGAAIESERLIVAHLGNGASMAAIKGGQSIETTMGFSTLAGLPMGTRSGDLDPGIVLYLLLKEQMPAETVQHLLYECSGLLGVSEMSSDMQELLQHEDRPEAAEAIAFFCARARAYIGSLTTALGGIDRLVFTGGIGANAAEIRRRICEKLAFLGVDLDPARNAANARIISRDERPVVIEALPTDEEFVIARHTVTVMRSRHATEKVC